MSGVIRGRESAFSKKGLVHFWFAQTCGTPGEYRLARTRGSCVTQSITSPDRTCRRPARLATVTGYRVTLGSRTLMEDGFWFVWGPERFGPSSHSFRGWVLISVPLIFLRFVSFHYKIFFLFIHGENSSKQKGLRILPTRCSFHSLRNRLAIVLFYLKHLIS